jgi:hypothetical protein
MYQIMRTSGKVYATNFIELGDNKVFDGFKEEISKIIDDQRHQYSYDYKCDNDFVLEFITSDLILDIKNFIVNPTCPLKKISELDGLGNKY